MQFDKALHFYQCFYSFMVMILTDVRCIVLSVSADDVLHELSALPPPTESEAEHSCHYNNYTHISPSVKHVKSRGSNLQLLLTVDLIYSYTVM